MYTGGAGGFSWMPNSSLLNTGGKKCITIATVLSHEPKHFGFR